MKEHRLNSLRSWSVISGVSLLIMAVAAGIAYGSLLPRVYVEGNPTATAAQIQTYPGQYLGSILLWVLILLTDITVSYGFYRYLATIRRIPALVSGLLRLIYSGFLAIGIAYMMRGDIESFMDLWSVGLVIFGLHLIVTGAVLLSGFTIQKVFGLLLAVSGFSYTLVHGIENFIPQAYAFASTFEQIMSIPMAAAELLFAVWLIAFGGRNTNRSSAAHPAPGAA